MPSDLTDHSLHGVEKKKEGGEEKDFDHMATKSS